MARHLIHIGFPKTGSTSLQQWFVEHPAIASVHNGIAGAHGAHDLARTASHAQPQPAWWVTSCESFTYPVLGSDANDRSPFPVPLRQERVCEVLAALFPGSSILIVTRGFHALVHSLFSEYVRVGGTTDLVGFLSWMLEIEEGWNYDRIVAMYCKAFGEDRVCVLPFEQMRDDPGAFVRTIESFLGLEPAGVPLGRLNPSLSPNELLWYPRLSRAVDLATRRRPGLRGRYRRRIGHPALRAILDRLPGRPTNIDDLPPEFLEGCFANTSELRRRSAYARFHKEYVGDSSPTVPPSGGIAR